MVVLQSADQMEFTVEKQVAEQSVLLKNLLEDVGETDAPIPLPNVSGSILKRVLEYCKHHQNDPTEESEAFELQKQRPEEIEEWDAQFIKMDNELLFEVILAANYLDIKGLLDLGCKTMALMLKGKTTEEIRQMLNIENDFTPEEEMLVRRENEWAADC
ncbi:putative negative regulator sulfur controller-3 [Gorgonomyces haynaldii]|nr:putative negative regulator sulfur controller-3 [Gorgonomyces haynaldii]